MPKLKLDKADSTFSQYVRARDGWTCVRCGGYHEPPTKALHCSHYFGRGREGTRFDPENADALCHGCHQYWGSADKEGYRNFKINQLGQKGFDLLTLRANTYKKKDRKMSLLEAKALLQSLDTV
jgi:hypothetical protein